MQSFQTLLRILALQVLAMIPVGGLGLLLFGPAGLVFGSIVAFAGVAIVGFLTERLILRFYPPVTEAPVGLQRTLERVAQIHEVRRVPKIYVFADPSPNALVARSIGGTGTLLISQGMAALLNEAELRAVLTLCLYRNQRIDLVAQTLSATLASGLLRLAPRQWVATLLVGQPSRLDRKPSLKAVSLTVLGFCVFLAILPLVRAILSLGGTFRILEVEAPVATPDAALQQANALRKIEKAAGSWGIEASPATLSLCLHHPWKQRQILSLIPGI